VAQNSPGIPRPQSAGPFAAHGRLPLVESISGRSVTGHASKAHHIRRSQPVGEGHMHRCGRRRGDAAEQAGALSQRKGATTSWTPLPVTEDRRESRISWQRPLAQNSNGRHTLRHFLPGQAAGELACRPGSVHPRHRGQVRQASADVRACGSAGARPPRATGPAPRRPHSPDCRLDCRSVFLALRPWPN
jgi:hypothetical protein